MPAIPGNVNIVLPEEAVLCPHYAQLCNRFDVWPKDQAMCCKLNMADYGCMQL